MRFLPDRSFDAVNWSSFGSDAPYQRFRRFVYGTDKDSRKISRVFFQRKTSGNLFLELYACLREGYFGHTLSAYKTTRLHWTPSCSSLRLAIFVSPSLFSRFFPPYSYIFNESFDSVRSFHPSWLLFRDICMSNSISLNFLFRSFIQKLWSSLVL